MDLKSVHEYLKLKHGNLHVIDISQYFNEHTFEEHKANSRNSGIILIAEVTADVTIPGFCVVNPGDITFIYKGQATALVGVYPPMIDCIIDGTDRDCSGCRMIIYNNYRMCLTCGHSTCNKCRADGGDSPQCGHCGIGFNP